MSYTVVLTSRAARDRRHLTGDLLRRVTGVLAALAQDARPPGCRKMTGVDEWRVRTGDYRIRYRIDDTARQVLVNRIAHRREVYGP